MIRGPTNKITNNVNDFDCGRLNVKCEAQAETMLGVSQKPVHN